MAVRVDRSGMEDCIKKINEAIETLRAAAKDVDSSMNAFPQYWEGAAYDKARATYEEQYQKLLTNTVPTAVEDFKNYINQCMEKIIEIDNMLSSQ